MKKLLNYLEKKRKKLKKSFLPLHEPEINRQDQIKVLQDLKTGYVSSVGKEVKRFENKIKKISKSKFVISTINGTSALHIGLKVLGVKNLDEVLLPSIGFVAIANSVLYNNAIPHFVDSNISDFGVDPIKLNDYLKKNTYIKKNTCFNNKTHRIIRALIVVHVFGHPAQITKLIAVAKKYKIKVIEDAAEALGSLFKGKQVGTFGDIGILSFNGNKIVTSGNGGAILTNNKKYAKISKHITTTAKLNHKWDYNHDTIGFNYRLSNINASLGISQIKKINLYIKHKKKLYHKFKKLIKESKEIELHDQPKYSRSNFWLQTIVLKKSSKKKLNNILNEFHTKSILARPVWKPLHKLKFLKNFPKMNLKNAEDLENRIINIPSSYYL